MYQYIVIAGNVGRAPELRYTPTGTAVCDFSVAVNKRWSGADGKQKEKTTWFKVTVWGKAAEPVNKYLTKGRQVLVTGEVDVSAWVGQDGEARATLEITASDVKFLGARNSGETGSPQNHDGTSEDIYDIPF